MVWLFTTLKKPSNCGLQNFFIILLIIYSQNLTRQITLKTKEKSTLNYF